MNITVVKHITLVLYCAFLIIGPYVHDRENFSIRPSLQTDTVTEVLGTDMRRLHSASSRLFLLCKRKSLFMVMESQLLVTWNRRRLQQKLSIHVEKLPHGCRQRDRGCLQPVHRGCTFESK